MTSPTEPPYEEETYKGGLAYLRRKYATRLFPFQGVHDFLPDPGCDFEPLKTQTVVIEPGLPRPPNQTMARKVYDISPEFEGQPEMHLLHAMVIAISRHNDPPPEAMTLFFRMWEEQHPWMIKTLNSRWKVSALKTFADHGKTDVDRNAASMLVILISMMQLYESERLWSGKRPIQLFNWNKRRQQKVALGLNPYPVRSGDMERNLLMWVWETAEKTSPGLHPLCTNMLTLINRDRRTLFRRIRRHKLELGETDI